MKRWIKLAALLAVVALYAALGWVVGLVLLLVLGAGLLRQLVRVRRARAATISCPWCRAEVAQYGPYSCGSCHARTLGWAWRCSACAAWSGHITCPDCSMSILNPLLPKP